MGNAWGPGVGGVSVLGGGAAHQVRFPNKGHMLFF